jgi:hypothetical protein
MDKVVTDTMADNETEDRLFGDDDIQKIEKGKANEVLQKK